MRKILITILLCISISSFAVGQDKSASTADDAYNATAPSKETTSSSSFSQEKFIPDISLILDMSYVQRNMKDETYDSIEIPDMVHAPSEEAAHGHDHGAMNSNNGFNLNYAELGFYSVVDPYFDLFAVCHLSAGGAELEEAYFTTLTLPWGFKIKGGKFLSGFGRINEQHAHYLDFAERPLIYQGLFGAEGLNETGMRLIWVAPLDFYMALSGEALMGENESSFGRDGFSSANKSINIEGINYPCLYVGNLRTSFDIGSLAILSGASAAFGKARINHDIDETGDALQGDSMVLGGDITLRYQFDSFHYMALQGEYLFRHMEGNLYEKDTADVVTTSPVDKKQSGMYAQLVAGLSKEWRLGIRYDLLHMNRVKKGSTREDLPENDPRFSAMAEYKPTEFSRLRAQYNYDRTRYAESGKREVNHEMILQANLLIGAHGAHSF